VAGADGIDEAPHLLDRELSLVLEVEEVVADLLFGEAVGRGVEVVGQLPDGAEVSLLGTLAEAGNLEILEHALTERRGHVTVLSQREMKQPLRGTIRHELGGCQGEG
jgi:hypothetical protein